MLHRHRLGIFWYCSWDFWSCICESHCVRSRNPLCTWTSWPAPSSTPALCTRLKLTSPRYSRSFWTASRSSVASKASTACSTSFTSKPIAHFGLFPCAPFPFVLVWLGGSIEENREVWYGTWEVDPTYVAESCSVAFRVWFFSERFWLICITAASISFFNHIWC